MEECSKGMGTVGGRGQAAGDRDSQERMGMARGVRDPQPRELPRDAATLGAKEAQGGGSSGGVAGPPKKAAGLLVQHHHPEPGTLGSEVTEL